LAKTSRSGLSKAATPDSEPEKLASKIMKVAVVAFGGNALAGNDGRSSYAEQVKKAEHVCLGLVKLLELNYEVIITHGNGPQVGNLLIQQELSADQVPPMPLDVCVAMTQGQMGYMIVQTLGNMFRARNVTRPVAALMTRMVVARDDPAFGDPVKFIGPFFSADESRVLENERHWEMRRDSTRGWRRVVPSPGPADIVEKNEIAALLKRGCVVVACGGGGIPVVRDASGRLTGVAAVIDKDFAAERLASLIGAELLILVTPVNQVAIFYGTPKQRNLKRLTSEQARRYHAQNHFPAGSMGPKIAAAVEFLANGGRRAIITSPDHIAASLEGEAGTEIVP
jgi:carbamate kinase